MKNKVNEIKKINDKFKKLVNLSESIAFSNDKIENESDIDNYSDIEDDIDDNIDANHNNLNIDNNGNEYDNIVNKIRKMALDGMSRLAEHTDDKNYDILKKVWQICDKKMDDKKNIDNIQNK